jgi:hypothetical protein
MASCGPIPHRECPPLRTVRPGVRKRGRLRRGMGPNCPYMRTARPGVRKRGRLPCGMGLNCPRLRTVRPGVRKSRAMLLATSREDESRWSDAMLSKVMEGDRPVTLRRSPASAVGDRPTTATSVQRRQRWGSVPLSQPAFGGVRGGGPSHCSGGTSGTADAGIATVHPYACTLPSQLVLFGQKNPPAHLWAKRPVSTTSCAVDVRLRGGGKKHWVGEGGAKCG